MTFPTAAPICPDTTTNEVGVRPVETEGGESGVNCPVPVP